MATGGDQRAARLLGDTALFDLSWLRDLDWPDEAVPTAQDRELYIQGMWTEIRGVVLHAIWRARCDLFHGVIHSIQAATAQALAQVWKALRTLVYMKTQTSLRPQLTGASEKVRELQRCTWARFRSALLDPRHEVMVGRAASDLSADHAELQELLEALLEDV